MKVLWRRKLVHPGHFHIRRLNLGVQPIFTGVREEIFNFFFHNRTDRRVQRETHKELKDNVVRRKGRKLQEESINANTKQWILLYGVQG